MPKLSSCTIVACAWLLPSAAGLRSPGQRQVDIGGGGAAGNIEDFTAGLEDNMGAWDLGDMTHLAMQDIGENYVADAELPSTEVAMCVAGNARTFPRKQVIQSLQNFTSRMRRQAKRFDVFGYLTSQGDGPKGQHGWDFPALNAGVGAIRAAFDSLGPASYGIPLFARDVTNKTLDQHVVGRECFDSGYWKDEDHLIRSLNYLGHIQSCLQVMEQYESDHNVSYQTVIVARPDLLYTENPDKIPPLAALTKANTVAYIMDWFLAMPRRAANKFLDPKRAMPLTCRKGEPCCHMVTRTEDMIEYILKARLMQPCNCKTCWCNVQWAPEFGAQVTAFVTVVRPDGTTTSR